MVLVLRVMIEMADIPALPVWVNENRVIIIYVALCFFLIAHFFRFLRGYDWLLFLLLLILAAFGFVAFMFEPIVYIMDVFLIMGVYGITLYIVLCEILLQGVAQWLTKKRGEKWVKELDYFYLALGLVGILGSVNRIDRVSGRFSNVDILAPMVLVTAVVIRFIKTRAEIGGWNKHSG
jgi:hypothetical protein